MNPPEKRLFVPLEQAGRVVIEPRVTTTAGAIALFGARATFPLDRYRRRGQISGRQYHAGMRLYEDYALGPMGARQPPENAPRSAEPGSYEDRRLDACRGYSAALQRAGKRLAWIAVAVCCEDRMVADLARERERNVTELMTLLRLSLDLIGDAYRLHE